jgi:hypothetical protein
MRRLIVTALTSTIVVTAQANQTLVRNPGQLTAERPASTNASEMQNGDIDEGTVVSRSRFPIMDVEGGSSWEGAALRRLEVVKEKAARTGNQGLQIERGIIGARPVTGLLRFFDSHPTAKKIMKGVGITVGVVAGVAVAAVIIVPANILEVTAIALRRLPGV